MRFRFARVAAAVALIVLTSACNMTVRITTNVDANGKGTFGVQMVLDKELRGALDSANSNLTSVEDLFTRLRDSGWTVTRSEPDGGLDFTAIKAFKDQKGFEDALAELGSARSGGQNPLGGLSTSLRFNTSFLKTRTQLSGVVDTSTLPAILQPIFNLKTREQAQQLVDTLADGFQFEIKANLPGSVAIKGGDGTVTDGTAIWNPKLGTRLDFSAASSALKTGSLLMIGIPALLLLAGLGWFLLGRRQRPIITEAPTPADRRRITIPGGSPAPELLAIKPDVIADPDVPIVIDLEPKAETVPPAEASS